VADIGAIRRALKDRIGTLPDTTGYAFIPDAFNPPLFFVSPDRPFIDYQQVFGRGGAGLNRSEMRFIINYATNRIDEESAQNQIDEFLDPAGQVVSNLLDTQVQDSLSELISYIELNTVTATRYGSQRVGGTSYFGVQLQITVMV
jgi:hypothetical protein